MRLWITTDPYPDVTPEIPTLWTLAGAALIVIATLLTRKS